MDPLPLTALELVLAPFVFATLVLAASMLPTLIGQLAALAIRRAARPAPPPLARVVARRSKP